MNRLSRWFLLGLVAGSGSEYADAYVTDGTSWPSGNITMQLQLGPAGRALSDGLTSWDDVAAGALDTWNPQMQRSQFVYVKNSTATKARANSFNNVFFDSTVYGDAFGDRVLAVTLLRSSGTHFIEADVVVNSAKTWDSYRGNLRSTTDLQRVLLHEFGHVVGLDHPDQATPPQTVASIMNSSVSSNYTLQPDDIAGAAALYGSNPAQPPVPGTLSNETFAAGSPFALSLSNTNPANSTYTWTFTRPGGSPKTLLDGDGNPIITPSFSLFSAQLTDAGTYSVAAINGSATSPSVAAQVNVTAVSTADAVLANISARGKAGSGSNTFIVGFVIAGSDPKPVMVRAVGPTLTTQGVSSPVADPKMTLVRIENGTATTVGVNDNWSSDSAAAANLRAAAQRLGAFALPDGSKDAALLITLTPGVYTAQVDAQGGTEGVALLEVYDADTNRVASLQHRLVNVSTRSFAGAGDEQLFVGFVVSGSTPKQVLIRAVGPGLTGQGVTGVNTDPNLVLFQGQTQIADNDDWSLSNQTDILPAAFTSLGAFQLATDSYDSALLITLPPGVYSAKVNGRNGETGVVLLEVYEVP